jgi:hypothetical protein
VLILIEHAGQSRSRALTASVRADEGRQYLMSK